VRAPAKLMLRRGACRLNRAPRAVGAVGASASYFPNSQRDGSSESGSFRPTCHGWSIRRGGSSSSDQRAKLCVQGRAGGRGEGSRALKRSLAALGQVGKSGRERQRPYDFYTKSHESTITMGCLANALEMTKTDASNIAIERARKTLLSFLPFDFMTISGHLCCRFTARWVGRGDVSASTCVLLATPSILNASGATKSAHDGLVRRASEVRTMSGDGRGD
jgi:hypothetical protein